MSSKTHVQISWRTKPTRWSTRFSWYSAFLDSSSLTLAPLPICRKRIIFLTPPTQSRIHAIQFTLQTNEIDNSEKIFIFRTIIQDLKEGGKDKRYNKQFAQSKRFYVEKN